MWSRIAPMAAVTLILSVTACGHGGSIGVRAGGGAPAPSSTTTSTTTGISTSTTIASGTANAPTSERYSTSLVRQNGEITIDPPPPNLNPTYTQAQIRLAVATTHLFDSTLAAYQPDIRFGVLTDPDMGPVSSDGSVSPKYVRFPVWVVRFDSVPDPSGPFGAGGEGSGAGGTSATPTSLPPVNILVFFDAMSGRYLFATQGTVGAA